MNVFSQAICKKEEQKELRKSRRNAMYNLLCNCGVSGNDKEIVAKLRLLLSLLHKADAAKQNEELKKDPLYRLFNQLNRVLDVFNCFGKMDDLKPYFSLVHGAELTPTEGFTPIVKGEDFDAAFKNLLASFNAEDGLKDELKAMAQDADEKAICPKNRFGKLTRIAEKAVSDKDKAEDLLQNERAFSAMVSHGADIVEEMLG